jgi:shikimate dehydrogenase
MKPTPLSQEAGAQRSTGDAEKQLAEQRDVIDHLDEEILRLFNERLVAAGRIGELKQRLGLPVRDSRREAQVFRRLMDINQGGLLANRYMVKVFAALMAAARNVQESTAHAADGFGTPALFAVFGNPVLHSLSPVMHNAAFAATGFNGVYAAIRVKDIRLAAAGVRSLGLRGASVTLPYKQTVMACLDAIDPSARRIQAVNTIVNENGELKGFNTDCAGALQALEEKVPVSGRTIAVIGAGGAARAVAHGVLSAGGKLRIFNRSREKGEALATELGAEFRPLDEFTAERIEILVNTSPVGMTPQVDQSPVPRDELRPGMVVMDIVYHPLKTRLLREAEAAGCVTIDGLAMFVYQGARQFELWTGLAAPVDIMRMAVEAELTSVP